MEAEGRAKLELKCSRPGEEGAGVSCTDVPEDLSRAVSASSSQGQQCISQVTEASSSTGLRMCLHSGIADLTGCLLSKLAASSIDALL